MKVLTTQEKRKISKVTSSLCVKLTNEGNPDFRQYAPIAPDFIKPAKTLKEASDLCLAYIAEWDLGGGNWTGGDVYHPIKGKIASISYNGAVWKGDYFDDNAEKYPESELTKTWEEL